MSCIPERWVTCPQCQGRSLFAPTNPYRPFCSARCKGVDLGAWASEQFRVADAQVADPDGQGADLPHSN